jgi:hypothetical protein
MVQIHFAPTNLFEHFRVTSVFRLPLLQMNCSGQILVQTGLQGLISIARETGDTKCPNLDRCGPCDWVHSFSLS